MLVLKAFILAVLIAAAVWLCIGYVALAILVWGSNEDQCGCQRCMERKRAR